MSCTVIAVPYALLWVVGTFATAAVASATSTNSSGGHINNWKKDKADIKLKPLDCDDIQTITEEHFIENDFETPFMDKNLLLKTLEEHGVREITETDNKISGSIDGYKLNFEKREEDKPYILKISCSKNDNAEEKITDLNSEYAMNVQEDAYLHILDKLKENNMSIEEEVVEDDNTIVLTVNIDG